MLSQLDRIIEEVLYNVAGCDLHCAVPFARFSIDE